MQAIRTILGCAGVVLILAGPAGAAAAGQARAFEVVAAVGNNMNHVPSFVGVEKGLFLKYGVDVKLKVLGTGQEMTKAVQAGEAQFLGAAFSNFAVGVERGFRAKGFIGLTGDRTIKNSDDPVAIVRSYFAASDPSERAALASRLSLHRDYRPSRLRGWLHRAAWETWPPARGW